ncbi:MAG: XRE family transcriptional regulator [Caldisericum exile]|uniref:XRE family transcriptional regulator n=1 Tax=Caldisericum exile TaxID=693075 RepID=UPI003C7605DD
MYLISEREKWLLERRRKDILLKDIAEAIGCSIALLSYYENGTKNLSAEKEKAYKEYIAKAP